MNKQIYILDILSKSGERIPYRAFARIGAANEALEKLKSNDLLHLFGAKTTIRAIKLES